jgi:hypothetical protein
MRLVCIASKAPMEIANVTWEPVSAPNGGLRVKFSIQATANEQYVLLC